MHVAARPSRIVSVSRWPALPASVAEASALASAAGRAHFTDTVHSSRELLPASSIHERLESRSWRWRHHRSAINTADGTESGPPPNQAALVRGITITGLVGAILWGLSSLMNLSWKFAALAFVLQWAFFLCHGWPQRSEQLYDASGSLTHIALIMTALTADQHRCARQLVLSMFAVIWCTRLGTFLFNRIAQDSKDSRFTALKNNFWTFSIPWNLQVLWVFLLQLPILVANTAASQPAVGALDSLGWALWCVGFLVEAVADGQKFAFRGVPSNKGRFITSGLWRYSRHPNYFGEILMWLGICTSCSSCLSGWRWLAWLSPAFNALLLLFVSGVPMLEKAGEAKWGSEPDYRHYMDNTSCIVPWFPAPLRERASTSNSDSA